MTRRGRAMTALGIVLAVQTATVSPASAHETGRYRTLVTTVRPHVAGLQVTVTPDGQWLRVANTASTPVFVLGYEGEPYLRGTAAGWWENTASSTSRLTHPAARRGEPSADDPAPHWVARTRHAWIAFHDLRVPRTTTHTVLARSRNMPAVITTWSLPLRAGRQPVTVTGQLTWRKTPVPTRGLALVGLLAGSFFVFLAFAARRSSLGPLR